MQADHCSYKSGPNLFTENVARNGLKSHMFGPKNAPFCGKNANLPNRTCFSRIRGGGQRTPPNKTEKHVGQKCLNDVVMLLIFCFGCASFVCIFLVVFVAFVVPVVFLYDCFCFVFVVAAVCILLLLLLLLCFLFLLLLLLLPLLCCCCCCYMLCLSKIIWVAFFSVWGGGLTFSSIFHDLT